MSTRCVPCDRDFGNDEALQQHKRDSSSHKFDCSTCDRQFRNDKALAQHYLNAAVHAQCSDHTTLPPMSLETKRPNTKRKSTKKSKPTKNWSMYPSLHNEVSDLLHNANLFFSFCETDNDNSCIDDYDTNIMGRFACGNTACLAVWTSKQIAITIRRYFNKRYNARVYYQSYKRCRMASEPKLDHSYAETVSYRLKK